VALVEGEVPAETSEVVFESPEVEQEKPALHRNTTSSQEDVVRCCFCYTRYITSTQAIKGGAMQSKTKTRFLLVAFTLIVLWWAFPEWRPHGFMLPYYEKTAANLRTLPDVVQQQVASARTSMIGGFVQHNIMAIGGVYALIALWLLLKPQYRDDGWEHLGALCFGFMAFVVWFIVAAWIGTAGSEMRLAHGGTFAVQRGDASWLIKLFTGLIHPLLMIALGLSVWIGIPLYLLVLLFTLPSVLFVILRLLVRLPVLIYHHLHYLTVPHPAETAYRAGMAANLPLAELASTVADAMCESDFKGYAALPKAWKSKNWTKRIDAFHARLEAQDRFMEELKKNLRLKHQVFRE
jgi:hypothetical protein